MKWIKFTASACLASACATTVLAHPQEANIQVRVQAQSGQDGESALPQQEPAKDGKPEQRNVRVIMRRSAIKEDGPQDGQVQVNVTVDAPPKIWLGVGLKEVTGDLATYLGSTDGVFLEDVFPDSPAAAAKLQAGDIVVEFNGEKLSAPADLVAALHQFGQAAEEKAKGPQKSDEDKDNAADKKDDGQITYPAVKLTVKRQDKQMTVEVTPGSRPESLTVTAEAPNDLKKGTNFLVFGDPKVQAINKSVIVLKEDDKTTQVQIDRGEDGKAKITIKDDQGERTLGEDDVKDLPEKLRKAIETALKQEYKPGLHFEHHAPEHLHGLNEKIMKDVNEQIEKAFKHIEAGKIDPKNLPEQLKKLAEMNGVVVIGPEVGEAAKKWAGAGAGKARVFMAMPEELESLHKEVEALKKEIEALKEELKASKK